MSKSIADAHRARSLPKSQPIEAAGYLYAQLTPAEYGYLSNKHPRAVRRMIERGEFPPDSVIYIGSSKHRKQARLLTAKLLAAGWLVPPSAQPVLTYEWSFGAT